MDNSKAVGRKMTDWSDFFRQIQRMLLCQTVLALAGAVLLWLLGYEVYAIGWMYGTAFNLVYLAYLNMVVHFRRHEPASILGRRVATLATLKFFFAIILLILLAKTGIAHIGATLCGLLSYRIVLYWIAFRRDFKHISKL